MDVSTLGTGAKIAAVAAIALLIVMFLPWFGIDEESATSQGEEFQSGASTQELQDAASEVQDKFSGIDSNATSVSFSAWETFGLIDIVLLLVFLLVIALVAARASATRIDLPVSAGALTAALGLLAAVLILFRIIDPPSVSFLDFGREWGVFVGLVAALGIAYGGWRWMQEDGTTFGQQADRLRAGGDDAPPPPPPATPPPPASPAPPAG